MSKSTRYFKETVLGWWKLSPGTFEAYCSNSISHYWLGGKFSGVWRVNAKQRTAVGNVMPGTKSGPAGNGNSWEISTES